MYTFGGDTWQQRHELFCAECGAAAYPGAHECPECGAGRAARDNVAESGLGREERRDDAVERLRSRSVPQAIHESLHEGLHAQAPRRPESPAGRVYFLGPARDNAPVKIGFTTGVVENRLKSIQTGYPERLTVLATVEGTIYDESALHARFARARLHGEWFKRTPELMELMAAYRERKKLTAARAQETEPRRD